MDFALESVKGGVVDEGYSSETKTSYLQYLYYEENGDIRFAINFEREAGPKEIADTLKFFAGDFLANPEGLVWDDVVRLSDQLIQESQKILSD